jgi:hypothetical protein
MNMSDYVGTTAAGRGRPGALVLFGLFLLIGFALPVLTGSKAFVPGIEVFDEEDVEDLVKIFFVFPAAAGIALVIVAATVSGPARGIVTAALGALGCIVLIAVAEDFQAQRSSSYWFFGMFGFREVVGYVVFLVAMGLLLGGSRARWHVPWSLLAAVLGTVGGALAIFHLVLPYLPRDTMPVELAVDLIDTENATVLGIALLLSFGLTVAAAIVCFANWKRRGRGPGRLGNTAFWLALSGLLVLFLGIWGEMLDAAPSRGSSLLRLTSLAVKWAVTSLGYLLLLPLGISDLLVSTSRTPDGGVSRTRPRPAPARREEDLPVAPVAAAADDVKDRLQQLKSLYEEGLITQEEFEMKRKRLVEEL